MQKHLFIILILIAIKAEAQSSALAVADSLYILGNYTAAINSYAKIADEKSNLQIARAYNAIGDYEKASLQYLAILAKNKENTLAKFELGKLYNKTKNYEDAIPLFKDLANPENNNPEFYYYLGRVLQSDLDYTNGTIALQKAVALDSTHLRSIYLLGKYYVGVQEPTNALEIINLGLQTAPNDVALINLKALAKFDVGEYEEAAQLFERLLELGERKPFIYNKLGYSYVNRWKNEEAKTAYRKLSEITNHEADGYKGLGHVFFKEKQLDSAEIYFKKSMEERRYIFSEEYSALGRIARLQNQHKKALEYYTKAWEEDKVNQFSYWQVCVMADEYYKDPKVKLKYYQNLLSNYNQLAPFLKERAKKRITELKEEIHFRAEEN